MAKIMFSKRFQIFYLTLWSLVLTSPLGSEAQDYPPPSQPQTYDQSLSSSPTDRGQPPFSDAASRDDNTSGNEKPNPRNKDEAFVYTQPKSENKEAPAAPLPKASAFKIAILQVLDKITAETLSFEAKFGETVRYKDIVLRVDACDTTRNAREKPDFVANLIVVSQPEGLGNIPPKDVFTGWMFAGAPAVHPFTHPLYDLWLITCKT